MTRVLLLLGTLTFCGLPFARPVAAGDPARDLAYCQALSETYRARISRQFPGPEALLAMDECQLGDPRGVPTLERILRQARIELPPHP